MILYLSQYFPGVFCSLFFMLVYIFYHLKIVLYRVTSCARSSPCRFSSWMRVATSLGGIPLFPNLCSLLTFSCHTAAPMCPLRVMHAAANPFLTDVTSCISFAVESFTLHIFYFWMKIYCQHSFVFNFLFVFLLITTHVSVFFFFPCRRMAT